MQYTKIILLLLISITISNCVFNWKVPSNYRKITKAFIRKQELLTHSEIQTFLQAIFKMDVEEDEESLMVYIANKYKNQLFPEDEEESFDGKQIVGYFKDKHLEEFVEEETKKIYDTLIEYYDLQEEVDEEMYKWITDGKTSLFGFTLENYLLAIENVQQLIQVNETDMESELEEAVQLLEQEFNDYHYQSQENQNNSTQQTEQNQQKKTEL